jgi:23S rRNA (cytosine1962-C5)-methyltransferase
MSPPETAATSKPTVIIRPRRAQPFFNRHPWVFAGAIAKIDGQPAPGDEVVVQSKDGQFIGRGLFNPNSNIRVRLYSWDESVELTKEFWDARIADAIALRETLPGRSTNTARRLVASEADGLSGLTVDQYGDWLLVQLTSLALGTRREELFDLLQKHVTPRGIILRTEKGIRELEGLEQRDGLVRGEEPPRPLEIRENGLTFLVDVCTGQKTGCYLDQRDNRTAVARYVQGHRLLDLFSYSGGFGITAAKLGEAASVVCVDSSEPALELARSNAEVNAVADRIECVQSDVFRFLKDAAARGDKYDTVILDPPKMARRQAGLAKALRGYHSLNQLAVSVVRPGGLLVTCSCSGHVSREDFEQMLSGVATSSGRTIRILESRGQAADHPVSPNCPENRYLKCLICRVS